MFYGSSFHIHEHLIFIQYWFREVPVTVGLQINENHLFKLKPLKDELKRMKKLIFFLYTSRTASTLWSKRNNVSFSGFQKSPLKGNSHVCLSTRGDEMPTGYIIGWVGYSLTAYMSSRAECKNSTESANYNSTNHQHIHIIIEAATWSSSMDIVIVTVLWLNNTSHMYVYA